MILQWLTVTITITFMCGLDSAKAAGWSSWTSWSTCSVSCNDGFQSRLRHCTDPPDIHGCQGADADVRVCYMDCAVDGNWGPWHPWSSCSVSCGADGYTVRLRDCDHPRPSGGGDNCTGSDLETSICHPPCTAKVDGGWGAWLPWSTCSVSCGHGYNVRVRDCNNHVPSGGGKSCVGIDTLTRPCTYDCSATWSSWLNWTNCSASCGIGTWSRDRTCVYYPGTDSSTEHCDGNSSETDACYNNVTCPVDGGWSLWGSWSACSTSCGEGTMTRIRECTNPEPTRGGQDCVGDTKEVVNCTGDKESEKCKSYGIWSSWDGWTICDVTCDGGTRFRFRKCSNSTPANDITCRGDDMEIDSCNTLECPIDGNWGDWFPWSSCTSTCGPGTRNRVRTCSNPHPQHGGNYCTGDIKEKGNCTVDPASNGCSLDGAWATWGPYGDCSDTCGDGVQTRYRTCTNPAPHGNGLQCPGNSSDFLSCSVPKDCPIHCSLIVDGIWSSWLPWFPCSVTCGVGQQMRVRTCTNPKPQDGGEFCSGDQQEENNCTLSPCTTADGSQVSHFTDSPINDPQPGSFVVG